ncbi:hypothetical protein COO60DRAFT_1543504 [Scenedesmus sp. NREL 46B-D3]|nr:hypothetical protein COO60DRAFT_1543504 [Scenedesmus sp. NREL 46B-D3]
MLSARTCWMHLAIRARSSYLHRTPPPRTTAAGTHMSTGAAAALPDRAHAVLSTALNMHAFTLYCRRFGPGYSSPAPPGSWAAREVSQRWYNGGTAVDQYIKEHFSTDVKAMRAGRYDSWQQQPLSAVAGIVLADQFTRNMYRGTADAFALDPKALSWAEQLTSSGRVSDQLPPVLRQFVVLPFMHSESLQDQQRCVDLVTAELEASRAEDPSSAATQAWAEQLQFAAAHRDVVAKWGRFPHRNALLGRQSTSEEAAGLADGSIGKW